MRCTDNRRIKKDTLSRFKEKYLYGYSRVNVYHHCGVAGEPPLYTGWAADMKPTLFPRIVEHVNVGVDKDGNYTLNIHIS